ncbi:MAG: 3-deoxy-manno-octulosonate cytidylyltransferase, partial [Flavobacteriaceae bacterium]|nr:3-deoxy-manno-octulosonate cytidylyltransferase [Flavobacteriaceae bacterium]
MKIAAVIPARLDSMRLPNKLLRDICGKSLII